MDGSLAVERRCSLVADRADIAGSTDRWPIAQNQPSRCLECHLLFATTGCQWRLLPREFPSWNTVYHYFRSWKNDGVWTCLQRSMYQQVRRQAGRAICPSVVIMHGQSVKTT